MGTRSADNLSALLDVVGAAFPHAVPELFPNRVRDPELGIDPATIDVEGLREFLGSSRSSEFAAALAGVGQCVRPIRLLGRSERYDTTTGELVSSYGSSDTSRGVVLLPCKNHQAGVCPYCARVYQGDVFQLIRAGVRGGKTVPEHVVANPLVFLTLTAPSFGKVHGRHDGTGLCHASTRGPQVCRHGRPTTCKRLHDPDDPSLGQPLCVDCYDYDSHLIWQWWAPALWKRFMITLRRGIARHFGVPGSRSTSVATVQYVKIAEEQKRGAVHFHALVRLDGPRAQGRYSPAPDGLSAETLADLIHQAAAHVRLEVPGVDADDPTRILAFGRQVDTRVVDPRRTPQDSTADELTAERVSGYLAKYATKSIGAANPDTANDHYRRLRATGRRLAARVRAATASDPAAPRPYARLAYCIDADGFRGHFATKSRSFSITLGALRRARQRAAILTAQAHREHRTIDLAAMEAQLLADDELETTVVIGRWEYVGAGWADNVETQLALASAARARQYDRERARARREARERRRARQEAPARQRNGFSGGTDDE